MAGGVYIGFHPAACRLRSPVHPPVARPGDEETLLGCQPIDRGFHGPVARYLGILAATSGHWEEAVQHFEDANEVCRKLGAKIWRARIQCDYARALIRRPDRAAREQGLAMARQVIEDARALESEILEVEAGSLL